MGKLTLILGGARSGKSSHAQRLAEACQGPVVYIATARALDEEMEARIGVHRQERPARWQTLEAPVSIARAYRELPAPPDLVLLDCLTMLVTNLFLDLTPDEDQPDADAAAAALAAELDDLMAAIRQGPADWIVVTNEVGLGLVPPYPLGRVYRDLLGWANQRLAATADEVLFMVAGIPVPVHAFRL